MTDKYGIIISHEGMSEDCVGALAAELGQCPELANTPIHELNECIRWGECFAFSTMARAESIGRKLALRAMELGVPQFGVAAMSSAPLHDVEFKAQ